MYNSRCRTFSCHESSEMYNFIHVAILYKARSFQGKSWAYHWLECILFHTATKLVTKTSWYCKVCWDSVNITISRTTNVWWRQKQLMQFANIYLRVVRQRTGRQQTTMASAGTVPEYCYRRLPQSGEQMLLISAETGKWKRLQEEYFVERNFTDFSVIQRIKFPQIFFKITISETKVLQKSIYFYCIVLVAFMKQRILLVINLTWNLHKNENFSYRLKVASVTFSVVCFSSLNKSTCQIRKNVF